jgi:hypothetical protein
MRWLGAGHALHVGGRTQQECRTQHTRPHTPPASIYVYIPAHLAPPRDVSSSPQSGRRRTRDGILCAAAGAGGGGGGGGGALDRIIEPKLSRRQSRAADGCAAGLEPRRTDPNPLEGPHGRVIPDRIDNLHMRWDLGACTRPFCRLWLGSSTAWLLEL